MISLSLDLVNSRVEFRIMKKRHTCMTCHKPRSRGFHRNFPVSQKYTVRGECRGCRSHLEPEIIYIRYHFYPNRKLLGSLCHRLRSFFEPEVICIYPQCYHYYDRKECSPRPSFVELPNDGAILPLKKAAEELPS